jgi:hypothetical protein
VEASGSTAVGYMAIGFTATALLVIIAVDIPEIIISLTYLKVNLAIACSR